VGEYQLVIDGREFNVEVGDLSVSPVRVVVNGQVKVVEFRRAKDLRAEPPAVATTPMPAQEARPSLPPVEAAPISGEGRAIKAPMPGKILSILVAVGDPVSEGDILCTLEAMKMEMPISSTASGAVQALHAQVGDTVDYDDPLVTVG